MVGPFNIVLDDPVNPVGSEGEPAKDLVNLALDLVTDNRLADMGAFSIRAFPGHDVIGLALLPLSLRPQLCPALMASQQPGEHIRVRAGAADRNRFPGSVLFPTLLDIVEQFLGNERLMAAGVVFAFMVNLTSEKAVTEKVMN